MREIKFRAYFHNKVTKEKRMINWEEFSSYNGCGVILKDGGEFYHVMQSTGLKDKNGKEEYFMDILRHNQQKFLLIDSFNIGTVAVEMNKNLGNILNDGLIMNNHNYRDYNWLYRVSKHCEIIGNIYENPELLKRHC